MAIELSPAECNAARAMLANTFNPKAAAAEQNITLSTMYTHLASIRKRAHCNNTIRAILIATGAKIIIQNQRDLSSESMSRDESICC